MIQLLGRPGVRTIGLGSLALLMLLMPVSYRAGTSTAHAHTIFQGIVDSISDRPHHGDQAGGHIARVTIPSPFAPVTVPLGSWMTDHADAPEMGTTTRDHGTATTVLSAPDIPERVGLYSPIAASSPIHELGMLVALLLAGAARSSLWGKVNMLLQICITQDPPPPRQVS